MKTKIDLVGQTFGKLTVIEKGPKDKHGNVMWVCLCECGNQIMTRGISLKSGHTKSCGCYIKDVQRERIVKENTTHGLSYSPLYRVYSHMKGRCFCTTNRDYKYYGERGITICDEWLNSFLSFYEWAISNGYKKGLTIDRINVNGNYEPDNCRWATRKEQTNNRRNSDLFTLNNETHTLTEWAEMTGVKPGYLYYRIKKKGMTLEEAILSSKK